MNERLKAWLEEGHRLREEGVIGGFAVNFYFEISADRTIRAENPSISELKGDTLPGTTLKLSWGE